MTTPDTSTWRMADRLTDGKLAERIRALRDSGESWRSISRTLWIDHGVDVADVTVADWHRTLTGGDVEVTS